LQFENRCRFIDVENDLTELGAIKGCAQGASLYLLDHFFEEIDCVMLADNAGLYTLLYHLTHHLLKEQCGIVVFDVDAACVHHLVRIVILQLLMIE
jgi:hypothetical protein